MALRKWGYLPQVHAPCWGTTFNTGTSSPNQYRYPLVNVTPRHCWDKTLEWVNLTDRLFWHWISSLPHRAQRNLYICITEIQWKISFREISSVGRRRSKLVTSCPSFPRVPPYLHVSNILNINASQIFPMFPLIFHNQPSRLPDIKIQLFKLDPYTDPRLGCNLGRGRTNNPKPMAAHQHAGEVLSTVSPKLQHGNLGVFWAAVLKHIIVSMQHPGIPVSCGSGYLLFKAI